MVAVCAQESRKQFFYKRFNELDQYMTKHGFVPVNKFVKMWQMWLIVFIKQEY